MTWSLASWTRQRAVLLLASISLASIPLASPCVAATPNPRERSARPVESQGVPVVAVRSAVVNFAELERQERLTASQGRPPVRVLVRPELEEENEAGEPGADMVGSGSLFTPPPLMPLVVSPPPTTGFPGLNDIPMVDSSYIVIPPDVGGAVGLTRILQGQNNNYRIMNKADGSVINTLGTATFWAAVEPANLLNQLTDPRTVYDPYNQRWIAVMQSANLNGDVLLAVSQTSDPGGAWYLYRYNGFAGSYRIDFPIVGFNKNWIAITINRYTAAGAFSVGICLAINYPMARTGTGSGTIFTQAAGTHFATSPAVTYSATEDTLFLVTHLGSAGATYTVDVITGTPAAPVYTSGGTNTRPGGGWVQPSGNLLPQSAPVFGASACGATPCPIESQDAQVRSAPAYRNGLLHYTQTIGLPAGAMTHTAVQWTKITPSITPAFSDGGRIDDPTATSSNGGKWYAFPHIAVNANGDFMVGYTQYSSAQHPSAGYSTHMVGDAAGSIRDALIYHAGEDYYHKTFSTTTGRNRWGDFSTAQVDPSDDMTLWTVQQYAEPRTGSDDNNTGSNSSRWSTWWAALAPPSVTIDAGPSTNEGNGATTAFNFTVRLSAVYGLPVTVNFHTVDGTATVADNDYQALTSSVIIPAGSTTAPVVINGVGDTNCESSETFTVALTSANNNIPLGVGNTATGTILSDDSATITASAGANGSVTPPGATPVFCGSNATYTITPDAGYMIDQLLVDSSPVTPAGSYTFNSVLANHTISATFTTVTAVGAETPAHFSLGTVVPNPTRGVMQVPFGLPSALGVRVSVVDLQGREVSVLAEGAYPAGWHVATWDGRTARGPARAGLYFVHYRAAGETLTRKFVLAR